MGNSKNQVDVYLEVGSKRTFAVSTGWPGWGRSGRDEASALQALLDYGPRYGRALREAGIDFQAPESVDVFRVVERLPGDATTDFGAPAAPLTSDVDPIGEDQLRLFQEIKEAAWGALERAARVAAGKELRKGPRGGGRDVEGILRHVIGAEAGYLSVLGWKFKWDEQGDLFVEMQRARYEASQALAAAVRGELPAVGPRGGKRWPARYYVRRSAWHLLDHAWEIEDRLT